MFARTRLGGHGRDHEIALMIFMNLGLAGAVDIMSA
jgi:hypothetical protein